MCRVWSSFGHPATLKNASPVEGWMKASDYKSERERIFNWPIFRDQEYLDGCGCRKEKPYLTLFLGQRYIELLKSKAILLCCLVRALESRTEKSTSLHSPHAIVNASKVCSFRTVAEIKISRVASSKRSLIVAISEGMDSGSYVYLASQPCLFFHEISVHPR